jgi:putative sporulation protein YtaF
LPIFYSIIESFLLVAALSMDAFVSSFAYGTNKIKIPFKSVAVIAIVCSSFLAASIFLASFLNSFISEEITRILAFSILFLLGLAKFFDSTIKLYIKRHNQLNKELKFSVFNLQFMLNVYANPEQADINASKTLSPKEAVYLAIALSVDGLAVGFGAGLVAVNHLLVILFAFVADTIALTLGCRVGNKVVEKTVLNLSWLSGIVLIGLAFLKL